MSLITSIFDSFFDVILKTISVPSIVILIVAVFLIYTVVALFSYLVWGRY